MSALARMDDPALVRAMTTGDAPAARPSRAGLTAASALVLAVLLLLEGRPGWRTGTVTGRRRRAAGG